MLIKRRTVGWCALVVLVALCGMAMAAGDAVQQREALRGLSFMDCPRFNGSEGTVHRGQSPGCLSRDLKES